MNHTIVENVRETRLVGYDYLRRDITIFCEVCGKKPQGDIIDESPESVKRIILETFSDDCDEHLITKVLSE